MIATLLQAAETAATAPPRAVGWWELLIGSGLLGSIMALLTALLAGRARSLTRERSATALRLAIDGFVREMAVEGGGRHAKRLTRRIEAKQLEAGDKAARHNDAAAAALGTMDALRLALTGPSD